MIDLARGLAERRARRRRNALAAGASAVAVVALVTGILLITPGRSARHNGGIRDGALPTAAADGSATSGPPTGPPSGGLDTVDPAPASAEVSITLVPSGWVLLSTDGPDSLYGPPSLTDTDPEEFVGKLLVSVHGRIKPDGPRELTIAGYAADYREGDDGGSSVDLTVNGTAEVNVYVPAQAHLDRQQVIALANTVDVRSTAELTHG